MEELMGRIDQQVEYMRDDDHGDGDGDGDGEDSRQDTHAVPTNA